MKHFLIILGLLFPLFSLLAQAQLPEVRLPANLTVHIISPEPIQYVDISSKYIVGDLPLKNVLRIRRVDSAAALGSAVITIAGEKFMAQYRIVPCDTAVTTRVDIVPSDMRPLDIAGSTLSVNQLRALALGMAAEKPARRVQENKAFGLKARVNRISTFGDYIFLDVGCRNRTSLKYDIDRFRFKIDDKKVTKASNIQSVEIDPELQLFSIASFKKYYRNIFVFKKLTYPGNKVFHIELDEKQLSGRVITLAIPYQDLLEADTLKIDR